LRRRVDKACRLPVLPGDLQASLFSSGRPFHAAGFPSRCGILAISGLPATDSMHLCPAESVLRLPPAPASECLIVSDGRRVTLSPVPEQSWPFLDQPLFERFLFA